MTTRFSTWQAGILAAGIIALSAGPAQADTDNGHTLGKRHSRGIDLHLRYPGDASFKEGNVRYKGPDKGAYIERCYWTAEKGLFGLPMNFKQHCMRHTMENTK